MENLFQELINFFFSRDAVLKVSFIIISWILVFFATLIDLKTGIDASKASGVFKTNSSGLRQTLAKYKDYWILLLMGFITDMGLSGFLILNYEWVKIFNLPIMTITLFIYTVVTETISVKENIIKKRKGTPIYSPDAVKAINDIAKIIGEDKLVDLANLMKQNFKEENK